MRRHPDRLRREGALRRRPRKSALTIHHELRRLEHPVQPDRRANSSDASAAPPPLLAGRAATSRHTAISSSSRTSDREFCAVIVPWCRRYRYTRSGTSTIEPPPTRSVSRSRDPSPAAIARRTAVQAVANVDTKPMDSRRTARASSEPTRDHPPTSSGVGEATARASPNRRAFGSGDPRRRSR